MAAGELKLAFIFHALPLTWRLGNVAPNPTPPQHCMVGSTWFLSEQMQGHCYPEHMATALTSRLNYYRLTLSCPIIVVVYLVCDNNNISLSFSNKKYPPQSIPSSQFEPSPRLPPLEVLPGSSREHHHLQQSQDILNQTQSIHRGWQPSDYNQENLVWLRDV